MTIRDIYALYGIKPAQYRYLEAISENPGTSNDNLARVLRVSPQITGRITRLLEKSGLITDAQKGKPFPKREWYVVDDQEPLASIRSLLGNANEDRRF